MRGSNALRLETRQCFQLCYDGTNLLTVKIVDNLLGSSVRDLVSFRMTLVFDVEGFCNKVHGVDPFFSSLQVSLLFDPYFSYFFSNVEHFLFFCFPSYVREQKFFDKVFRGVFQHGSLDAYGRGGRSVVFMV